MSQDKENDNKLIVTCYIPYLGPIFSLYNLLSNKEMNYYCKFHNYHALFYGVLVFVLWIALSFMSYCASGFPVIGELLLWLFASGQSLINILYILSSLFWAFMTFRGNTFTIPFVTQYTNKYMEERNILPGD